MENDIQKKIEYDFGKDADIAKELLEIFEKNNDLSPRISRCIIFLSNGEIEKLKMYIQLANEDWRDVIDIASEYDKDFNKPFE